MVFRPSGANVFKLRVVDKDGRSGTFSTGTSDRDVAEDVERMVKGFKAQRRWAYLAAIVAKQAKLPDVYDAFVSGTLDAYMAEVLKTVADVDLQTFVTEWAKRAKPKYVAQVRVLIPEKLPFPRSHFSRGRISAFLAGLTVADPTRNRYRAAISNLAKWLVEREVLETNPVRNVAGYKEHDPRELWMTWKDAERVARKALSPFDTLILLLAGTGMEMGAARRLTIYDVDEKAGTIHAKGSKNRWRNRTLRAEPFVWAALKRHTLRGINGELFPGLDHKAALRYFRIAQRDAELDGHTLHDLRHTYAVNSLKAGRRPEVVAHQLGHRDASQVHKTYGRYIPSADDYTLEPATVLATPSRKQVKR